MLDFFHTRLMKAINSLSPLFLRGPHIHRVSPNVVPSHVLQSSHAGNHLIRGTETTDQCGQSPVPADPRGFSGESDVKLVTFHQGSHLVFFF